MELGAVVCVPNGAPQCNRCPLSKFCDAYSNGTQLLYPVKKKKSARKMEQKTVLILSFQDKIALRKREGDGVLSGMWELLKKKSISQYKLIKEYNVDKAQLQRLRKNLIVKTLIINRLCSILDCRVEDIMEYVPDHCILMKKIDKEHGACTHHNTASLFARV